MKNIVFVLYLLHLLLTIHSIPVITGFDYQIKDLQIVESSDVPLNSGPVSGSDPQPNSPSDDSQPQPNAFSDDSKPQSNSDPQSNSASDGSDPQSNSDPQPNSPSDDSEPQTDKPQDDPELQPNSASDDSEPQPNSLIEPPSQNKPNLKKQELVNDILLPEPYPFPFPEPEIQDKSQEIVTLLSGDDFNNTNEAIGSIIVTISSGSSYDQLFEQVKQESKEGTKVLVYHIRAKNIHFVSRQLRSAKYEPNYQYQQLSQLSLMVQRIFQLSEKCKQCIIFNWECSSGYSGKEFKRQGEEAVFQLLQILIDRGHIAMFSDFSLKALINEWDETVLGPNPFVQTGQNSVPVQLYFEREVLAKSPSTQLRTISELADEQSLQVNVLGGTIVYQVKEDREETDLYELQILTTATNKNRELFPAAGHVLLKYTNRGYLLTSMVHWIQLMRINTSAQRLFEVYGNQLGVEAEAQLFASYENLQSDEEKKSFVETNAQLLIQNQSPALNAAFLN